MSAEATPPKERLYQLKFSLQGISPMIWRRLLVPGSTSIAELHHIIQIAMGWENCHLHRFRIYAREYGISYIGGISFSDNPHEVRLADFGFRAGDRVVQFCTVSLEPLGSPSDYSSFSRPALAAPFDLSICQLD